MNPSKTDTIRDWFAHSGGGSLKTPNGWFGRPHNNVHQCTYLEQREGHLLIELDNALLLVIAGDCQVSSSPKDLTVSAFVHAALSWKEYGGDRMNLEVYSAGEISLIAPPG
jgi:hypothetical protein